MVWVEPNPKHSIFLNTLYQQEYRDSTVETDYSQLFWSKGAANKIGGSLFNRWITFGPMLTLITMLFKNMFSMRLKV